MKKIQRELIDFLGGGNFHWLRKEMLFLPKEEGGHGVVDIKNGNQRSQAGHGGWVDSRTEEDPEGCRGHNAEAGDGGGREQPAGRKAMAERLGVRSTRLTHLVLTKWRKVLTEEELLLLKEYGERVEEPDSEDPFPEITLTATLEWSNCSTRR